MKMTDHLPLITIAIPCYNHQDYIQDSILSAIAQDYANIELIIIDDGSKDQSVQTIEPLIQQCKERFVRFEFRTRPNKGLSNTLNEALEWSNGEYFCTLASDDVMLPNKTSIQVNYFSQIKDAVAICGGFQSIDYKGQIISTRVSDYTEYTFEPIFIQKFNLPASSQMIVRSALVAVGGFNPNTRVEDIDLWLRLIEAGMKIVYIPHVLISYRSHENNISKNWDVMYEEVMKVIMQRSHHPLYPEAAYRVQKMYRIRPMQKTQPIKALFLRLKYYLQYLQAKKSNK